MSAIVIEKLKINMIKCLFQSNTHENSPGYNISSQVPSQSENCYLWCWFMLHWVREFINDGVWESVAKIEWADSTGALNH